MITADLEADGCGPLDSSPRQSVRSRQASTGAPSALRNIGVHDGRVTTVAAGPLDTTGADVIDATGQWVIPGIIDIHTHYDIETLCEPELSESLRPSRKLTPAASFVRSPVIGGPLGQRMLPESG